MMFIYVISRERHKSDRSRFRGHVLLYIHTQLLVTIERKREKQTSESI